MIKKILFITLTNIGDVILTLPALDYLRAYFPESKITVMTGPRPQQIFKDNPYIEKVIVYNKHASLKEKISLFFALKKEGFDLVVDLKNSLFGALLPARFKTSPFKAIPSFIKHTSKRHLYKVESIFGFKSLNKITTPPSLYIPFEEKRNIEDLLKEYQIREGELVVIAAGARSHIKRWSKEGFRDLIPVLIKELGMKVILVGDKDDIPIGEYIASQVKEDVFNLCGKTTLLQLTYLLNKADLLITNDSAVLHLASYLNIPVVAIFGPTDELKYGPWSERSRIVKKEVFCRPCQKAQCRLGDLRCMRLIKPEDVLRQLKDLLNKDKLRTVPFEYKRILVARTDRVGDVLLSTPVIKNLRDSYPSSYIAMVVSNYCKEILEGNPYLDEVLIYDKEKRHRGLIGSLKFVFHLRKKRFDLAIILHPTNRMHLVTFLARIPKRIGYNRKLGFLLTDKIPHTKQEGRKHELEYNLDLLRYLGIPAQDKTLFMPIRKEAEDWIEELFKKERINPTDKLLAIHPGASCPSKLWPAERFAELADRLADKYGFKLIFIAGRKDINITEGVIKYLKNPVINLAGKTSLSQLASILRRCQLFISNDSGPVHIATAVGTPVISIFGRNQKGLSPLRWRPLGRFDRFIHKDVGCSQCLAHNCKKGFLCLKAITVEEVLEIAKSIIVDLK
ncbi:MAG: lipopolysaccharide heptosyltransferase II [Candidatus Omnitrophica bacterium]|nr:lipopolysaccharide heptosyltransferase II [Candidatus Omnitrophota bacterium]